MRSATFTASALLLTGAAFVQAQTFTDCNPLQKSCPEDPALGTTINVDFTKGASNAFSYETGTTLSYGANGAEFTISQAAQAPTIQSNDYIFFGKISVTLRAAPGVGIVSSFILESDDLDEIDWEWLGGNDATVESNFFGKGNTTTYNRAVYENVADPINTWHTYTIDWTSAAINWYIDGGLVRTLNYGDALALGGYNYPQTPMRVKVGNWVGCASAAAASDPATQGTCEWAGGPANWAQAPFVMYVKDVTIQDYGCAQQYKYGDNSGSWQSIQSIGGCSGGSGSTTGSGGSTSSSSSSSGSSSVRSVSSTTSTTTKPPSSTLTTTTSTTTSTTSTTSLSQNSTSSTVSTTPITNSTTTSLSSTAASTSTKPAAPPQVTGNAASKTGYGSLNLAIGAVALGLGYFVM